MALLVSSLKRRTSPENENGGKKKLHGLLLLENIKQQVNQLAGTLNILMAKVGSGLHAPTYEMPEEFQFPLDSDGELERFEEWLRNPLNERMKTDLATSLSSVGGVDTKRVVWNILARMITCTVARRINWKGVNGKRAFSKMAMKIVLFPGPYRIWNAGPYRIWNAENHIETELDQCWPISAADPFCGSDPVSGRCAFGQRTESVWRIRARSSARMNSSLLL
ncbi:hypothetical protein F7725_008790 [Dissostichus mawsoni]|uniref:DUF4806 domain-containing protein n=1 Tax=Dissostichus mawsoni TaxID=36200 RepID=A0A7J5YAP6_DISMA|nr:hypothetical protein F7725_008790 [Dissostichus mawsoni]